MQPHPSINPPAYTAMSDAAMLAITRAHAHDRAAFHIGLKPDQMVGLLACLQVAYAYGDEDVADFAVDLAAGIAAALGVEVV